MKTIFTIIALTALNTAFAFGPGLTREFKESNAKVALELEKVNGEVLLHILAKDMDRLDHIIVERSMNSTEFFSQVKYIQVDGEDMEDANYLLKNDKYPLPAKTDAYYRIKTVSKDGKTTVFPSVMLAAN